MQGHIYRQSDEGFFQQQRDNTRRITIYQNNA